MKIEKPGIYDGVPMESYIADPCPEPSLSKGVIHTLSTRTPLHARAEHPRLGGLSGEGGNDADMGSAIHGLVCGGAERILWHEFKAYQSNDAKACRDSARAAGRIPMYRGKKDQIEDAAGMATDFIVRNYGPGRFEQTIIWQEENGVWCRTRPDFIADNGDLTADLKTCMTANPQDWSRASLASMGYDIQAVHGLAGIAKLTGRIHEFAFLVVEVDEPHAVSDVGLDHEYTDHAIAKRERAIRIWRKCLDTNEWPGYPERRFYASPPVYKTMAYETHVAAADFRGAS